MSQTCGLQEGASGLAAPPGRMPCAVFRALRGGLSVRPAGASHATLLPWQVPLHLLRTKITKPTTYHESKLAAKEYQAAKARLFTAFVKAGLGAWVEKPTEQDQFSLTP